MRTMSFAIIIHRTDIFKESVLGLVRDDNLHEYIDPENTEQLCKNKDEKHRRICNWLQHSHPRTDDEDRHSERINFKPPSSLIADFFKPKPDIEEKE